MLFRDQATVMWRDEKTGEWCQRFMTEEELAESRRQLAEFCDPVTLEPYYVKRIREAGARIAQARKEASGQKDPKSNPGSGDAGKAIEPSGQG